MKNIYSLLFAVLIVTPQAIGKTTGVSIPNIFPHYGSGGSGGGNNFPSTLQSRIKGVTYLEYNGTMHSPIDSTTYTYSYGRGGYLTDDDLNDNFVNFDSSHTYLFDPALGTYRNQFLRFQVYNEANKVKMYTCKTWRVSTSIWKDSARFIYTYNNDQTLLQKTMFQVNWGGSWVDHVFYDNYFDANNKLTKMYSTVYRMYFSYDAAGNIVERVDSVRPQPNVWVGDYRYTFGYNMTNQMTTYIVEEFDGVWKNYSKNEYSYTGTDLTTSTEYSWVNNAWQLNAQHQITYDNNHNKVMDVKQDWDATTSTYTNAVRLKWIYNTFGQPIIYYSEAWDAGSGTWVYTVDDFMYRYYYESFTPASAKTMTAGTINMLLYPQPAQHTLNIKVDMERASAYTISIYDVTGSIVKQINGTASSVKQSIPVQDMATGNYFLKLSTAGQQQTQQFVVTH